MCSLNEYAFYSCLLHVFYCQLGRMFLSFISFISFCGRGAYSINCVEISPHDSASVSCFNSVKFYLASLVAQTLKRLPTMQETQVQFLCREDLLEKEMAPHSSTLAWKIPWTEDPGRLQSMGSQRVRHN